MKYAQMFCSGSTTMFHNAVFSVLSAVSARALVIIAAVVMQFTHARAAEAPLLSVTVINGAGAYTPTELFPVYRDQLGRPITRANAQTIITGLEALYLRDGYSRPEFRLDDDLTASGILRIEVFEAQIAQVVFRGDAGPYARKLAALAEELRAHTPVRSADIQTALQKMRALPGLSISATTRRDEVRRNSYALLVDAEFKPLDATVELTNRGTREIGPAFVLSQLVGNNLFGWEERLGVLFSAATDYDEYRGGGVFFDVPVNERGTHITATGFASRSNPTERFDRDYLYRRERMVLRVTQPLDLGTAIKVALSAGLDFDDLEVHRSEVRLRNERLRIAEVGARLSGRGGPATQYLVATQVRQGIDGLGSELEAADLLHDRRRKDFLMVRAQYTQLTQFAANWTARFDALGQYSGYVLPDAERYKIGGERLGRGFEVAEIAGDQGIGAKIEVRRDFGGALTLFSKSSLYGFYDFGAAWKQDVPGRESAVTSGVGFAMEYRRLNGFIEFAKPLTHADVEGDRDVKVFAELSLKL